MAITIRERFLVRFVVGLVCLYGCAEDDWSRNRDISYCYQGMEGSAMDPLTVMMLGGAREEEHLLPGQVEIYEGESVRFVSLDHRVHSLSFVIDSLSLEMESFLSETGQLILAPVMIRGGCVDLDFGGAPPGDYVFLSRSHGDPVYGKIVVRHGGDL